MNPSKMFKIQHLLSDINVILSITAGMLNGWISVHTVSTRKASVRFGPHGLCGQRSITVTTYANRLFGTPTSFWHWPLVITTFIAKSFSASTAMVNFLIWNVQASVTWMTIRNVAIGPPIIGCNAICYPSSNTFAWYRRQIRDSWT